jgi:hypothetical protein
MSAGAAPPVVAVGCRVKPGNDHLGEQACNNFQLYASAHTNPVIAGLDPATHVAGRSDGGVG